MIPTLKDILDQSIKSPDSENRLITTAFPKYGDARIYPMSAQKRHSDFLV